MQSGGVGPGVVTEQPYGAGIGSQQTEQDPNGRRLSRSVRSEKPVHLPRADEEIETVQGPGVTEALRETADRNGVGHRLLLPSA